jgi:hypothetical protein
MPLRGRFDPEHLVLDPSPLDPDPALAIYVAEPSWKPWMVNVLVESRELRDAQQARQAAGITGYH